jgi:hypothetical protein
MTNPIQILLDAGVTLRIDEHGKLKASPGRLYTSELQAYVNANRAAIIDYLLITNPAQQLAAAGFHLDLLPGGKIKVEPVKLLTREWVRFVRAHRSELIESLMAVEKTLQNSNEDPVKKIIESGLSLRLVEGGNVDVMPAEKITPEIREFIRNNKSAIVEKLTKCLQGDIHLMAMTILEKLQPVLLNAIYTELMEHKK